MTAKRFLVYRLIAAALIGAIVSLSITLGNYILPVAAILTFILVLRALKKQVKEVLEDERDYEIAGKAARYALSVFSAMAAVVIIVLFARRGQNPLYEAIGSTLAYAICALLIFYSLIFKYFQKLGK